MECTQTQFFLVKGPQTSTNPVRAETRQASRIHRFTSAVKAIQWQCQACKKKKVKIARITGFFF